MRKRHLSLYSTAMQNHSRWVFLRHLTQKIPTCWYLLNLQQVTQILCVTQCKSQGESVKYRLGWVPNANFLHWPCFFVLISFAFGTKLNANAWMNGWMELYSQNPVSSILMNEYVGLKDTRV